MPSNGGPAGRLPSARQPLDTHGSESEREPRAVLPPVPCAAPVVPYRSDAEHPTQRLARSGDSLRGGHLRYPARRTLAWRRASRTAGPSTSGGRFVCWLVGSTVADPVPMMSWGNGCWRRDRQRDSLRTFSPWHIASNLRQGEGGEAGSWPGLGLDGTLDSRNSSTTAGRPFAHRATKVRPSQARSVWSRRRASRSRAKSASVLLSTRV